MNDTHYFTKIAEHYDVPEFVKQAEFSDEEVVKLSAYASPTTKEYPCNSAANTWLSAVKFHEKYAEAGGTPDSQVERRLLSYVNYYRMKSAYDKLTQEITQRYKQAELSDEDYAYTWQAENGEVERTHPLHTPEAIKAAAQWVKGLQHTLTFRDKHVISKKILSKAAQHNVKFAGDTLEFLERNTAHGVTNKVALVQAINNRKTLIHDEKNKRALEKLANEVNNNAELYATKEARVKIANILDVVDHAAGIAGKYSDVITSPEASVTHLTYTKAAEQMGNLFALNTGAIYEKDQCKKIPRTKLAEIFGEEFASDCCTGLDINPDKMAEVAETLPLPDAEIFESLLKEADIFPVTKQAATYTAIEETVYEQLSQSY